MRRRSCHVWSILCFGLLGAWLPGWPVRRRWRFAMKAAVLRAVNAPLTIEEVQIDRPGPREVLIHTGAVGVCHSDLHFIEGKYPCPTPAILGHEAAGTVEAVGELVAYVQPGDRVITC